MELENQTEVILKNYKKKDISKIARAKDLFLRKVENSKRKSYIKEEIIKPEDLIFKKRNERRNYFYYKNSKIKNQNLDSYNNIKNNTLLILIRIRGNTSISKNQKHILNILGLGKVHDSTLVLAKKDVLKKLKLVENFITFGEIKKSLLEVLLRKRTFVYKGEEKLPLNSNKDVETFLGNLGLICIEDLLSELFLGSKNFIEIMKFLKKFKLTKPNNGYENKLKPFEQEGSWGYRGIEINKLLKNML